MKKNQTCIPVLLLAGTLCLVSCKNFTSGGASPVNADSVKPHIIDLHTAIAYTKDFRNARSHLDSLAQNPALLDQQFNLADAESLNRDVFQLLLNQKDSGGEPVSGIRMYHGRKFNDVLKRYEVTLVLVPYDKNGNDITAIVVPGRVVRIPGVSSGYAAPPGDGSAVDNTNRCPTYCDGGSSGLGAN